MGRWARARTAAERDGDNGHVDGEGPVLMRTGTHLTANLTKRTVAGTSQALMR